jgi:DNA-binding transcriptional MerR regulator
MARTLTVSKIAEILERQPRRQITLVERIRHWTREGLIRPIGQKNPGTGRHRQYNEFVLLDVGVLNVLANLGFQVGQQQSVVKQVKELYNQNMLNIYYGFAAQEEVYIVVSDPGGEEQKAEVLYVSGKDEETKRNLFKLSAQSDAVILINVGRIYKNVSQKHDDFERARRRRKTRFQE